MADLPAADTAPVRAGEDLDWAALEAHLRANVEELAGTPPMEVAQFPGGSANLTYCVRFGPLELVVRRPPFGIVAPGAHDMRREHKVLSRLWRFTHLAPRAYLFCDEHSVIGSDFVVMERRVGEVIRGEIPASMAHHDRVGERISLALVDAIAELHALDPAACGLGDLGKPDGFVARQVSGWAKRWDLVRDPRYPQMDDLHRRLETALPASPRVSFVHNDLKLDNCQFDPSDPDRVRSFFDWDMTTIGDPLIDLGTLLNYWPDPSDPPAVRRASHEGMLTMGLPPRAAIAGRYAERTGVDLASIGWYEAFAQWKTAVVVQQLHMRWVRGESTDPRMATIADSIPLLIDGAERALTGLG